jgi:hypothetical protein
MGVLVPGTWEWGDTVPVFAAAIALFFVPGAVAMVLMRARVLAAICVGPVVSTALLAGTGVVLPLLGVRWGLLPFTIATLLLWAASAAAGRFLRRLEPHGTRQRARRLLRPPDAVEWAAVVGLLAAGTVVAWSVLAVQHTPEAFPQQPDTIFHLGAAQWMLDAGTVSSLEAGRFQTPTWTGFYPSAFHGFTATTTLLTGAPVVVSTSVVVLVVAGVVWPLGCIALAVALLGRRPTVVLGAALMSVALTAFPYQIMGFGVLWPDLLGEALVPASVAGVVAMLGRAGAPRPVLAARVRAAFVVVAAVPALLLAHPDAFLSALVFVALLVAGRLLGAAAHSNPRRLGPHGRAVAVAAVALALLAAAAAAVAAVSALQVESMANAGKLGTGLSRGEATASVLLLAAEPGHPLVVATVLVALGCVVLLRTPGARWCVPALLLALALWWLNYAVDNETVRRITWPWYNTGPRIQTMSIVPAVVAGSAAISWLSERVERSISGGSARLPRLARSTRPSSSTVVAAGVALGLGLVTLVQVGDHQRLLRHYFDPPEKASWVTPGELLALRRLSHRLPQDAVVAANPWRGATYLYVVSGRRLLVPTEKTNYPGDVSLLSERLDEVGSDAEVCAAARHHHMRWAITGGEPVDIARQEILDQYRGVDAVGDSAAWRLVATAAPYRLYERQACAG